jgi:ATP-dependent RNA helicase DHX29
MSETRNGASPRAHFHSEVASEQLKAGFRARQASPGYQEMLVGFSFIFNFVHLTLCLQQHRNQLPIAHYRDEIISTLDNSQILVLSGETGW